MTSYFSAELFLSEEQWSRYQPRIVRCHGQVSSGWRKDNMPYRKFSSCNRTLQLERRKIVEQHGAVISTHCQAVSRRTASKRIQPVPGAILNFFNLFENCEEIKSWSDCPNYFYHTSEILLESYGTERKSSEHRTFASQRNDEQDLPLCASRL